jgi:hypothetical protein
MKVQAVEGQRSWTVDWLRYETPPFLHVHVPCDKACEDGFGALSLGESLFSQPTPSEINVQPLPLRMICSASR